MLYLLFFCLLLTVGTFTSVFKDNKLLRSQKAVKIKLFLNFLLVYGLIRIRYDPDSDPGVQEAQKLTDPKDPVP